MRPTESASPTPNCGGRFARRRSLARAAVNVSEGKPVAPGFRCSVCDPTYCFDVPKEYFMKYAILTLSVAFAFVGCQAPMAQNSQPDLTEVILTNQTIAEAAFGLDELISHANSTQCATTKVPGRGVYPDGWFNGMVLAFARSACRGMTGTSVDTFYSSMVESVSPDDALGRLTKTNVSKQTYTKPYNKELARYSAANHPSGKNQLYLPVYKGLDLDTESKRLEVLYSLLLTLGMRESSGGKDNGIDRNASYYKKCMQNTPEQCEAGSLQASQNSSTSAKMKGLFPSFASQYWNALSTDYEAACGWSEFNEGISAREEDPDMREGTLRKAANKYQDFRNLMIGCPIANVEYNAVLLRKTYAHHGPIKRFEAPLFGDCIDMFAGIHDLIKEHPEGICDAALAPLQ
jgi:hypothetical protein